MTYPVFAKSLIEFQHNTFKDLHNFRFFYNGYEYRIIYEGGFTCMFKIDRREIGKRNFKYWKSVSGWKYSNVCAILSEIQEKLDKEVI